MAAKLCNTSGWFEPEFWPHGLLDAHTHADVLSDLLTTVMHQLKQQKQAKMIIEQLADMHSSLPQTAKQGLQHAMRRKPIAMHCYSASIVPFSAGPHNMQVYLAHQHSHILNKFTLFFLDFCTLPSFLPSDAAKVKGVFGGSLSVLLPAQLMQEVAIYLS